MDNGTDEVSAILFTHSSLYIDYIVLKCPCFALHGYGHSTEQLGVLIQMIDSMSYYIKGNRLILSCVTLFGDLILMITL